MPVQNDCVTIRGLTTKQIEMIKEFTLIMTKSVVFLHIPIFMCLRFTWSFYDYMHIIFRAQLLPVNDTSITNTLDIGLMILANAKWRVHSETISGVTHKYAHFRQE